jgi:hypothetical protein
MPVNFLSLSSSRRPCCRAQHPERPGHRLGLDKTPSPPERPSSVRSSRACKTPQAPSVCVRKKPPALFCLSFQIGSRFLPWTALELQSCYLYFRHSYDYRFVPPCLTTFSFYFTGGILFLLLMIRFSLVFKNSTSFLSKFSEVQAQVLLGLPAWLELLTLPIGGWKSRVNELPLVIKGGCISPHSITVRNTVVINLWWKSHTHNPFCYGYFSDRVLCFLPGPGSSYLCLLHSRDYKHATPHLAV